MFDLLRLTDDPFGAGPRSEQDTSNASGDMEPVPGFRLTSQGLFIEEADQRTYVCDPIVVLAFARTPESSSWSKQIVMLDRDGVTHERIISAAQLMRFGFDVCATLIDEGLRVAPNPQAMRWLLTYLTRAEPKTRALIAERPGWIQTPKSVFYVQAHRVVGRGTETVVLAPDIRVASKRSESGTVEQWRDTVGAWSVGNSRLMMGISMAFASMTLAFAGLENGGINLVGPSSCGKTTVLGCAASVMGAPAYVGNWRQTDNAFEAAAVPSGLLSPGSRCSDLGPPSAAGASQLYRGCSATRRLHPSDRCRIWLSPRIPFFLAPR
ncbi:DUF927 domain-containing protein [Variovorax sp. dw_308]|uniref:DUF927 domain-containing protein n=1 Tax=Variovorax sp. dw_308 TaxID=2721546 RepID=UPI001C45ADEE|nr:DUF927 domain-containing protein [Variovorax sp. dw_308]